MLMPNLRSRWMAPALFALDSTSILHDCCPAPLLGNSVALVSLACYTAIHTAPAQVVEPAILTPAVPVPQLQQVCRLCPNGSSPQPRPGQSRACCSRTPLQVNCAYSAVVAAPPHACPGCACLPVVPNKQHLGMPVVGPSTT